MSSEKLDRAVQLRLSDTTYAALKLGATKRGFRAVSSYIRSIIDEAIKAETEQSSETSDLRSTVAQLQKRLEAIEQKARASPSQKAKGGLSGSTKDRMERSTG